MSVLPVPQHFLDRITNVQWGSGLAVELSDGGEGGSNSYVIWKGETIKMSKGTISLWFRVPKETIDAMEWKQPEGFLNPFQNAIPILVFSGQHYGPWTEFEFPVINTFYKATNPIPPFDFKPFPYYGSKPQAEWQLPYNPCMIAVYIGKEKDASLGIVLQTMDVGVPENTNQALVDAEGIVVEGKLFGPTKLHWQNASAADAKMDWFENSGSGPEVKTDVWHHLLLSWDLQEKNEAEGNPINPNVPPPDQVKPLGDYITARSKLYCAFDDVNLIKDELPTGFWVDGFKDNEIVCYSCWRLAGMTVFNPPPNADLSPPYTGFPKYTVTFAKGIEMDTVAVPSAPKYEVWTGDLKNPETKEVTDVIKKIEVAELQIFSDFLLDTAGEGDRRAFIDYIEKSGGGANNQLMGPVDPKTTEEILGRRPDILLHTSKNWKKGKNTGEIGLERGDEEDTIKDEGQFEAFGEIKKWMPDPRLLADGGEVEEEK